MNTTRVPLWIMSRAACLAAILCIATVSAIPQTKPSGQSDFDAFYAHFRAVVKQRDPAALKQTMSPKFQWALDGLIDRDTALKNISTIIGWPNFWQSAVNATVANAAPCKKPYCMGRPGFHASAKSPFPLEMMFEKDSAGKWHWSAVLGD